MFSDAFCLGLRTYIFKEEISTVEAGKKKYQKMQIAHYTMMAVVYSSLFYIGYHLLKFYGLIDLGEYFLRQSKSAIVGLDQ